MSLESPAPSAFRAWLAEDADKVPLRVPCKTALRIGVVQDLLEAHDLCALLQSFGTHDRCQQGVGHVLLILLHLAERQAMAGMHFSRDEVPAGAVVIVEFECGLGLLLGLERGEEGVGCIRHFSGSLIRVGHSAAGERQR